MGTKEDEYRRRSRRAYAGQTQKRILTGRAFLMYLEKLGRQYCLGQECRIDLQYQEHGQWAAETDGQRIRINAANPVTAAFSTLENRASSIVGLLVHEAGHINYSDFDKRNLYGNGMKEGILYPRMPAAACAGEEACLEELREALSGKDPHKAAVVRDAALTYHNMLEDMYIEAAMCVQFGEEAERCLRMNNRRDAECAPSIRAMEEAGMFPCRIMDNVLIQHLFTGQVNDWEGAGKRYLEALENCREFMQEAISSADADKRFAAANLMLLKLWPMIREEFTQNSPARKHAEYEGKTDGKRWRPADKREKAAQEAAITAAVARLQGTEPAEGSGETARALAEIRREMACREAAASMEEELAGRIARMAEETDYAEIHKGIPVNVRRASVTEENIREYNRTETEVLAAARRLEAGIAPVLERCRESREKGKMKGRRLDGGRLYRQDHRIFVDRNRPCEEKNVAAAVVMDESGSMRRDGRIDEGRFLARVLYEFCSRMGIPVLVIGHTTSDDGISDETVEICSYAEFDSVDGMDCYRLMGIRAQKNNRDGAALKYAGARLAERPEKQKILFMVTDGQPYAFGYCGEDAMEDIRKIKKELEKEGIHVTAAAIGDDREEIREIYGEDCLNISDMKRLPGALAALIAGRMER